ncbi:MAG: mannose-1-phosphate guanylyltransferase/mannose-6-phosphate isomerase, partial [bacterium]
MKSLYALILVGGAGTRLWPVSRQFSPKQFMRIGGEWSLFQETVLRLSTRVKPENMIFVTGKDLEEDVQEQLRRLLGSRSGDCTVVGEPVGRNTAPAILLGAR